MKKTLYRKPEAEIFILAEDVVLASNVIDDGDVGIGYDEIFGTIGGQK